MGSRKSRQLPDQELLLELLEYNSDTGELVWKKRGPEHFESDKRVNAWNGKHAGKVAGCEWTYPKTGVKYLHVRVNKKTFLAHRIIWKMLSGEEPPDTIDHLDGNGLNNKWDNLRDGSGAENYRNMRRKANNKSGHNGVSWSKAMNKWWAQGHRDGVGYNLGYYEDIDDAVKARKKWEEEVGGFSARHGLPDVR